MGKAEKLKAQRKIDKVRRQLDREKKFRLSSYIGLGLIFGALLGAGVYFGATYAKDKFFTKKENKAVEENIVRKFDKAPEMQIDTNKTYIAKFETENGDFQVTLNPKEAPKTVNNFVFLAQNKFYDGLTFHRIVKDFMIQGGDPDGTGGGGPGYKFDDEPITSDYMVGTIAMANSGANTNGSQFFIMTGDYSGGKLPKNYTIFGNVTSGLEVVQKINALETQDNGQGEKSKPVSAVKISKVTIEEK
jgi:cyclophilin family peptidyl-prolyl cis-trans isomerase